MHGVSLEVRVKKLSLRCILQPKRWVYFFDMDKTLVENLAGIVERLVMRLFYSNWTISEA